MGTTFELRFFSLFLHFYGQSFQRNKQVKNESKPREVPFLIKFWNLHGKRIYIMQEVSWCNWLPKQLCKKDVFNWVNF